MLLSEVVPQSIVPNKYDSLFNVDITNLPRYMLNTVVNTANYEIKVVTGDVIDTKFPPETVVVFDSNKNLVSESSIMRLPNGLYLNLPKGTTVILTTINTDVSKGSASTDTIYDWFSSCLRTQGYSIKDLCNSAPFVVTLGLCSLDKLAYKFYKSHDLWWVISEYNNIMLHEQIEPGTLIQIPYSDDVQKYVTRNSGISNSVFSYKGQKIRV